MGYYLKSLGERHRIIDAYGDDETYTPVHQTWHVIQKTPKGAWIVRPWALRRWIDEGEATPAFLRSHLGAKFVLDGNGRRFAHETLEWARESFRIRKVRQIQHCRHAIERAEAAISWLETGKTGYECGVAAFAESAA